MRQLRRFVFGGLIGIVLVAAPGAGGTGGRSLDDVRNLFGTVRNEWTESSASNGVSTEVVADLSVARTAREQPGHPPLTVLTGTWRETRRWSDPSQGCSQVFTITSSGGGAGWIYFNELETNFRFRSPSVSLPVTETYEEQGPCYRRVGAGRGSPIRLQHLGLSTGIGPGHPSRLTGVTEGTEVSGFGVTTRWRMTWDLERRREGPPPVYLSGKFATTIRGGAIRFRGRWILQLRPGAQRVVVTRNGRQIGTGTYETPARGKIKFVIEGGSMSCKVRGAGGIPGEYAYSLRGRTLRMRPVDERCSARRVVFGRKFVRAR